MRCLEITSVAHFGASPRCWPVSLVGVFSLIQRHTAPGAANDTPPTTFDGSQAGPPGPAEVFPGTAIHVTLGMQDLRTRVFRSVELKDHPLRIRNAPDRTPRQGVGVVLRELKVYGANIIFPVARGCAGSDDHAARRPGPDPSTHESATRGRASVMPCRPLPSARPRRDSPSPFRRARNCPLRRSVCRQAQGWCGCTCLKGTPPAKRAPDQDADACDTRRTTGTRIRDFDRRDCRYICAVTYFL